MARNRKRAKDRRTRRPPQSGSSRPGAAGDRSGVPGIIPSVPSVPIVTDDEPSRALEREDNGAPDPLEHATPDVELAEEQLAVGRPEEPEPGDEADETEFEAEVEESIARGGGDLADGGLADGELAAGELDGGDLGGAGSGVGAVSAGGGSAGAVSAGGGLSGAGSSGAGEVAVHGAGHAEAARPGIFARMIAFLQGSWRELQRVQWPDRRQVMQATGVVIGFVIVCAAFLGLADLVSQKVVTFILK